MAILVICVYYVFLKLLKLEILVACNFSTKAHKSDTFAL